MDGDDLPDGDFESIYGAEALRARTLARLVNIEQSMDCLLATMRAMQDETPPPSPEQQAP